MCLKEILEWKKLQNYCVFLSRCVGNIDENELFDEFTFMKTFVTETISSWNSCNKSIGERWFEVFTNFERYHVSCTNLFKIGEFFLSLPASNAPTERIFSAVNKIWTSEKIPCLQQL